MTNDPMANTPATDEPTTPEAATPADASPASAVPAFGWNNYAERINGRFAMIGFVALLILEWFSGQDFFTWLGLR